MDTFENVKIGEVFYIFEDGAAWAYEKNSSTTAILLQNPYVETDFHSGYVVKRSIT